MVNFTLHNLGKYETNSYLAFIDEKSLSNGRASVNEQCFRNSASILVVVSSKSKFLANNGAIRLAFSTGLVNIHYKCRNRTSVDFCSYSWEKKEL